MRESIFKIGDWVYDGDDFGSIVSINEKNQTVDLFDGKEGWTADINSIMPNCDAYPDDWTPND